MGTPIEPGKDHWPEIIEYTLLAETGGDLDGGGMTDDPRDAGKLTKFGISQKAHPDLDIANLTYAQAVPFYRKHYWDKVRGDKLPYPVAFVAFDFSVVQGWPNAAKHVQRAVGAKADGIIGPRTLSKVRSRSSQDGGHGLAVKLLKARKKHFLGLYKRNPKRHGWSIDGWLNRCIEQGVYLGMVYA